MSTQIINHVYKFKRGTEEVLFDKNPLLLAGEPLVVLCDDNIIRLKIGDGNRQYVDLPFINKENDEALKELTVEFDKINNELRPIVVENSDNIIKNDLAINKRVDDLILTIDKNEKDIEEKLEDAIETSNKNEIYLDNRIYNLQKVVASNEKDIELKLSNTQSEINDNIKTQLANLKIQDINSKDKILSVKNQKLYSTLSIAYDRQESVINLLGIDNQVISSIDVSDFIISGMLDDVSYDPETNIITFTWNTISGLKSDTVELDNILDPYQPSDGIDVDGTYIKIKIDPTSDEFLSVSGSGLKLSGVQTAIDTLASNVSESLNTLKDIIDLNSKKIAEHTQLIRAIQDKGYITDEQASELITESLNEYVKRDEIDNKINTAINAINIDKIDGGRISDGD